MIRWLTIPLGGIFALGGLLHKSHSIVENSNRKRLPQQAIPGGVSSYTQLEVLWCTLGLVPAVHPRSTHKIDTKWLVEVSHLKRSPQQRIISKIGSTQQQNSNCLKNAELSPDTRESQLQKISTGLLVPKSVAACCPDTQTLRKICS